MKEPGWKKSASSQITISAFLAGISATLFVLALNRTAGAFSQTDLDVLSGFFVIAICLFAMASEIFTDSLEFSDIAVAIRAVLSHDLAIVSFLLGLACILWADQLPLAGVISAAFSSYFGKDCIWLLKTEHRREYERYLRDEKLTPQVRQMKFRVPAAILSALSAGLGAYVIFFEFDTVTGVAGFVLIVAVSYAFASTIYFVWADFTSDAKVTSAIAVLLLLLVSVYTGSDILSLSVLVAAVALALARRML